MLSGERPAATVLVRGAQGRAATGSSSRPTIAATASTIYGAGHVGRAMVGCWRRCRSHHLGRHQRRTFPGARSPTHRGRRRRSGRLRRRRAGRRLSLVMTYSHALDLAICHALLARNDFAYLGLIGSATKRARFSRRLADAGIAARGIARLTWPIGMPPHRQGAGGDCRCGCRPAGGDCRTDGRRRRTSDTGMPAAAA